MGKWKKRFIITSAQACVKPHPHFMKSLETYADENDAEMIVLPMIGQSASEDTYMVDDSLTEHLESGTRKFNSNVQVEQFNIRPYQIDPLTGLNRFAQRGTSLIFASPKQRLKPIAHSNKKLPKVLMTTGACTKPNYATGRDVSAERRRLGNIAKRDHVFGAVVVEVENDEFYHFRHVRADKSGKFVDLGWKYDGEEVTEANLEAMVCGDWHVGMTDEEVRKETMKMIEEYAPRRLVLHDFFNGASVSHHVLRSPYTQKLIQIVDKGLHRLDYELELCYDTLSELSEIMEGREIYLAHSNHHEFLTRYLEEGRFIEDLPNVRIASRLLTHLTDADYNDPVEAGIKMKGKLPRSVKFLKADEDLKVRGYQLGAHGHRGASGGRGSMNSKENDWGKSVSGHVHQAQIMRDTYTVGTMLPANMYYCRGYPSNWTHTHGMLWDTGTVQLVNIIEGRHKLDGL